MLPFLKEKSIPLTALTVPVLVLKEILRFFTSKTLSFGGINSIGSMINEGKIAGIATYPHILLFPSIVISLLMISFNLFH